MMTFSSRHDRLAFWALVLMFFDHVAFLAGPWLGSWAELARLPGRFCMPAFALMAALGASGPKGRAHDYLRRLVLLALVSELPYWLLFHEHVNAVFALAVGVAALILFREGALYAALGLLAVFAAVCVVLGAGFESIYALLVVFLGWRAFPPALVVALALAALLNPPLHVFASATVFFMLWALYGPLPPAPRLPRAVRYAFYPVHLVLLSLGASLALLWLPASARAVHHLADPPSVAGHAVASGPRGPR